MIKEKVVKLKKEYKTIKSQKRKELLLEEMKDYVKLKEELADTIQILKDMVFALDEAKKYGKTFSTAKKKIKDEIKNLEVLKISL